MLAKVFSAAVWGVDAFAVEVEANATSGKPVTVVVGLPDVAVKESRDRVITAVNSRVFYADNSGNSWGASILVATGGPDFGAWALRWAQNHRVIVCGVTPGPPPYCRL